MERVEDVSGWSSSDDESPKSSPSSSRSFRDLRNLNPLRKRSGSGSSRKTQETEPPSPSEGRRGFFTRRSRTNSVTPPPQDFRVSSPFSGPPQPQSVAILDPKKRHKAAAEVTAAIKKREKEERERKRRRDALQMTKGPGQNLPGMGRAPAGTLQEPSRAETFGRPPSGWSIYSASQSSLLDPHDPQGSQSFRSSPPPGNWDQSRPVTPQVPKSPILEERDFTGHEKYATFNNRFSLSRMQRRRYDAALRRAALEREV